MDAWQRVWSRLSGSAGPERREAGGPVSQLLVGLGNPGSRYETTPHNLGFLALDRLAEQEGIRFGWKEADARVGRGEVGGSSVLLAKPLLYMKRSGGPVKALLKKYELESRQLVVVYDELALPWGQLRIRERGSSAGHKGIQSILDALGTEEFLRVRMGIQPGHPVSDGAAFVLRPFRRGELDELDEFVGRAADAVRLILTEGAAQAMSVYNRRAPGE
jgi:PTH1 family peptidyl-tRNA hydrolase